jgi:multidrug efflux pump subunit AcrA (membrane-fusion protein)
MLRPLIFSRPFLALPTLYSTPVAADMAHTVEPVTLTECFGKVETRDLVPARTSIGGTLTEVLVAEGDQVSEGQRLGLVKDEKLALRLTAVDANLVSLTAQLTNAKAELKRSESLVERGVATVQRLDALRTQVDVVKGQIEATKAERSMIEQQRAEGAVLVPIAGRVLNVRLTKGAVVMPGEAVAMIGGGGVFCAWPCSNATQVF